MPTMGLTLGHMNGLKRKGNKFPSFPSAWVVLLLLIYLPGTAQEGVSVASVMFYNLENLYDTEDDPLKLDDEFLPEGDRRWTPKRLYTKLTRISKVIVNTGSWEPPAVIGFCEVENREVLERLVRHPPLKKWNYRIIHKDSPDERGIDVAAVYRPDLFEPLEYRYFPPVPEFEPAPSTREILYMKGILAGIDTLHCFFNHWPSRYGGLMETRPQRQKAAVRLKSEIMAIQKKNKNAGIVVMGDFNDQPADLSLSEYLGAGPELTGRPDDLCNLSFQWLSRGRGTLKYQSQWNLFDQIIVSGNLSGNQSKLFVLPGDATILEAPFLMKPDEAYTGEKLNRTFSGFDYQGGYSDHLPVLLNLRKRE